MREEIRFETPENIELSYELAGLGTRFSAWLLDQVLVTLVVLLLFAVLVFTGIAGEIIARDFDPDSVERQGAEFVQFMIGLFYLLYGLGGIAYFGLMELLMRGQTLGKRRMQIRVAQADGFTLRTSSILLRTIFRVADNLPPLWIVPLVSNDQRRLGDIVGGTIVVQDRPHELSGLREDVLESDQREAMFRFPASALSRLTDQDIERIEKIMERVADSNDNRHTVILFDVAQSIATKMELEPPDSSSHVQFLREMLAAHYRREYRRLG